MVFERLLLKKETLLDDQNHITREHLQKNPDQARLLQEVTVILLSWFSPGLFLEIISLVFRFKLSVI